ncbi:MAG: hypothetical protein O3A63_10000 [Proteobacteria bacterium]|nr:hypothetical protein [Pseudomonadota bacterium]
MKPSASGIRRSIFARDDDTWSSIAARELAGTTTPADTDLSGTVEQLQSWNMHVFMRPAAPADSPRAGNPILPSDVIFLEPPLGSAS